MLLIWTLSHRVVENIGFFNVLPVEDALHHHHTSPYYTYMRLFDEYVAYLKDNPKGYWFKRKLYGYGWTPAKPAGWATIAVYILFLLGVMWYADETTACVDNPGKLIAVIVGATVLLLLVTWKTGEPLKWQWGKKYDRGEGDSVV